MAHDREMMKENEDELRERKKKKVEGMWWVSVMMVVANNLNSLSHSSIYAQR
jgi:hypothetical protein